MRILILEDDPFIAMDLEMILQDRAHEIIGIYSSIRAARAHLADEFDYALLDIDVVDGKSFDVAVELLERKVPFAFVSASLPGDIPAGLERVAFIAKPFEEMAILRCIEGKLSDGNLDEERARSGLSSCCMQPS
ncbi:response regulator [Microvirga puerhi]|uniref:Response regulator n=1 Tax=Microvirga puerhi TaxID=2876078 RepID=A0ABS7VMZ0_9HYPH|nr:response regulator [Microvirga puerhi]MBZ6076531.1 response regulator [Microvirga puerhi]